MRSEQYMISNGIWPVPGDPDFPSVIHISGEYRILDFSWNFTISFTKNSQAAEGKMTIRNLDIRDPDVPAGYFLTQLNIIVAVIRIIH